MMLTGCKDSDENVNNGDPVRVELAYTFSPSAAGNYTRQSSDVVVPNTSAPRLPNNLMIVPMKNKEPQKTETTWNEPVKKVNSSRYTSLYYYSQYCDFEPGVNRCLVYGSADDVTQTTVDSRVYNGKLNPSVDFSTVTDQSTLVLNNLTFDLEPIFKSEAYNETDNTGKDGIPTEASTLAGYLTDVANSHAGELYWKNSTNIILKNLFDNFTNYGRNLPGSAASVKALLTALNTVAENYKNTSGAIGDGEKAILNAIIANTAADKVTDAIGDVTTGYPRNINLPDGAAALRWMEVEEGGVKLKKFMPQMQTTTLDNINTITRFAYPASLYYFVNSRIKTSEGMVSLPTEYDNIEVEDTKTAWAGILGNFAGDEVTATTKAVALKDPVQYAVAQLQVNTSYSTPSGKPANTLPDAVNANIEVDGKFILKGVIICGQRPVNYNFVPGDNSDALTKFIYDSQVKENCTLSASSKDACTTLVLQSYAGEDINVILEYENTSDDLTFKCVDGIVYPHTRFYLIGKVEALKGDDVNTDEKTHQVFTKDYITTVNMTVTSLAKAYNVLPNLLGGGLELGVELTTKWIQAETTNVLLNEKD